MSVLIRHSITALLLFTFVGTLFSLLFLTPHIEHMHGDCPLMAHEEVLCTMSASEHVTILRAFFESVLPSLLALVLASSLALTVIFSQKLRHDVLFERLRVRFRWLSWRLYNFEHRFLQALFASGILHPKLFSHSPVLIIGNKITN